MAGNLRPAKGRGQSGTAASSQGTETVVKDDNGGPVSLCRKRWQLQPFKPRLPPTSVVATVVLLTPLLLRQQLTQLLPPLLPQLLQQFAGGLLAQP